MPSKIFDEDAAKSLIKNQVSKPRNKVPTGRPSSAGFQSQIKDFGSGSIGPKITPTASDRDKYAK